MFDKLNEAQKRAEAVKMRLANIAVTGSASGGKVKITVDGNRKIKDIEIADELMQADRKEELQDLLMMAIEDAMEQADNLTQSEMNAIMSAMIPGLSSLFGKK
ncbi:MAG: YbaB/EbfC family nucleoid-associated protein [Bacteroidota bacterium]|jgi:DNA-binding YbaB/EbfC family protein